MKKYIPLLIACILLTGALFYGKHINKMDASIVQEYYKQALPEATKFEPITDRTAKAFSAEGQLISYVGISSEVGYGGPLTVCSEIDLEGKIKNLTIVEHMETPSYLKKIDQAGFYKQFKNKHAGDALLLAYDVTGVSGATLSSRAITKSLSDVAHSIADTQFNLKPAKAQLNWQIGVQEMAVALLFVLALAVSKIKKLGKFRLGLLALSIIILGFWLNRSLSMAQFSGLLLGYFPTIQTNLIWYLVLIGAILPALLTGKNLYCTYVCPFCGLQEATNLLSKTNLPLGKNMKWLRAMRDVILFLVIFFAFITLNPSTASFEPFGTIFGLNGSKFSWYLLFTVLVASFFYKRFWCNAFCPVGAILDKISGISRDIRKALKIKPKTTAIANKEETQHDA